MPGESRASRPHDPAPVPLARPRGRGGRTWLVGCLSVFLVVVLAVAAAGWWFVGRPFQQVARAAQDVTRIERLDQQVRLTGRYAAPTDGVLSADQVDRYVAVLTRVRDDLSVRLVALEARYGEIGGERPTLMDVPRLAGAYADFLRLLVDAKEAQVAGLNDQRFSLEEYRWVRTEVLRAAGMQGAEYDVTAFAGSLTGSGDVRRGGGAAPVPDANVRLVSATMSDLGDLAFLALLGF